jgi:hypothetical protein
VARTLGSTDARIWLWCITSSFGKLGLVDVPDLGDGCLLRVGGWLPLEAGLRVFFPETLHRQLIRRFRRCVVRHRLLAATPADIRAWRKQYPYGTGGPPPRSVPGGELLLEIHSHPWVTTRRNFRDTEKKRLEDQLNAVIVGFVRMAAGLRAHALREAIERRQRARAERRRREEERRRHEIFKKGESVSAIGYQVCRQRAEAVKAQNVALSPQESKRLQELEARETLLRRVLAFGEAPASDRRHLSSAQGHASRHAAPAEPSRSTSILAPRRVIREHL